MPENELETLVTEAQLAEMSATFRSRKDKGPPSSPLPPLRRHVRRASIDAEETLVFSAQAGVVRPNGKWKNTVLGGPDHELREISIVDQVTPRWTARRRVIKHLHYACLTR